MITHQLLNAMIFNSLYFAVIEVKNDPREEILFFQLFGKRAGASAEELKGEKVLVENLQHFTRKYCAWKSSRTSP